MPDWNQKPELKLLREIIRNLRFADDTTPMAENKEKLRSLFMRIKEESVKASLKSNIKN